jgi:hypothetical protein
MNILMIEKKVNDYLQEHYLEDLIEKFDLTPVEVFMRLYQEGLIDEEILEGLDI